MPPNPIYTTSPPPKDHIHDIKATSPNRLIPPKPSYGIDSPLGLVSSNILAPFYLYASLKGKFDAWNALLSQIPPSTLSKRTLDLGPGRGIVLLKTASLKKQLHDRSAGPVEPAYGIDLFIRGDQSGNSPLATYDNAAALGVRDWVVLHTGNFGRLPFADGVFGLVTGSLSIHNANKEVRRDAVREAARVLVGGGELVIVDLAGYVGEYAGFLEELGWREIEVESGGLRLMFGAWPGRVLKARKPRIEV
ncbi:hypothetical protein BDV23DRAFT_194730 [Aspergillus alliaceus]|uniref:Methyltransferase type 11 domain-containing protein n=1 Tax=Petromyces alliaceus TaxID=209559 RepID=A0A5N7C5F2_PETAA|nr:hypothetical protein BDV23DRAFT_194730 [Aspergillus alliaceus]